MKSNSSSICDHWVRFVFRTVLAAKASCLSFVGTAFLKVSANALFREPWLLTCCMVFFALDDSGGACARCTAMQPLAEGQEILFISVSRESRK